MLSQNVFIFNPSSSGGGIYILELYFQNISIGQYLRLGDYIEDTANNKYEVIAPTSLPHSDGAVVTVQFVDSDVLPVADVDYNSSVYTPNQVNFRPDVRTSGSISNPSLYSGPDYEYSITAGWDLPAESDKAQVGDSIVDLSGKEFIISFLDPVNKFNVPIRVVEVLKEAVAPIPGDASLYRKTANYGFFQGTPITDPSRTVVRNRDDFQVDLALKGIQDQIDLISGSGSGAAVELDMLNDSGSAIAAGTPVRINATGGISPLDPSVEAEALAVVGITKASINNGEQGVVVAHGKIENITTTAALNDRLYVSATGGITESQPDIGIGGFLAGDFVISLGVVSKNLTNPANKDLIINIEIIGQL